MNIHFCPRQLIKSSPRSGNQLALDCTLGKADSAIGESIFWTETNGFWKVPYDKWGSHEASPQPPPSPLQSWGPTPGGDSCGKLGSEACSSVPGRQEERGGAGLSQKTASIRPVSVLWASGQPQEGPSSPLQEADPKKNSAGTWPRFFLFLWSDMWWNSKMLKSVIIVSQLNVIVIMVEDLTDSCRWPLTPAVNTAPWACGSAQPPGTCQPRLWPAGLMQETLGRFWTKWVDTRWPCFITGHSHQAGPIGSP